MLVTRVDTGVNLKQRDKLTTLAVILLEVICKYSRTEALVILSPHSYFEKRLLPSV